MIKCILTDIEGTTTPISFVRDILFPYILENLEMFLTEHKNDNDILNILKSLQEVTKKNDGLEFNLSDTSSIISNIKWNMERSKKYTPLKDLQGKMWKDGYESGKIKGLVYEDVLFALKHWKYNDIPVYIYSSGSIEAQKLLFQYTNYGNLLEYFQGHYDTTSGSKVEKESYSVIARDIGFEPHEILFLSDNTDELLAAKSTGFEVCLLIRPGNAPVSDDVLKQFSSTQTFKKFIVMDENNVSMNKT